MKIAIPVCLSLFTFLPQSLCGADFQHSHPFLDQMADSNAESIIYRAQSVDNCGECLSWMNETTEGCGSQGCGSDLCPFTDPNAKTLLGSDNFVDTTLDNILGPIKSVGVPISVGGWHWFNTALQDTRGSGYGIPGIRGTYFWWVSATPEYDYDQHTKIGAHAEYRFRDNDNYRPFFTNNTWFYEAYGFVKSDTLGTFKAGQLEKKFGLDWGYGFWPSITNFSGYMQDPDYGVSWDRTRKVNSNLSVATVAQFFIVEDGVNGTFPNADTESVSNLKERNTLVLRVAPTWTNCDESTLSLGVNGLVQEIDSDIPGFRDSTVAAWGLDAIWQKGPWQVKGEVIQTLGRRVPTRYTSGGASNRLTDFVIGTQYAKGIMGYFADYSISFDDNPAATQELVHVGTSMAVSDHLTFFLEWVHMDLSGSPAGTRVQLLNALNYTAMWRY